MSGFKSSYTGFQTNLGSRTTITADQPYEEQYGRNFF